MSSDEAPHPLAESGVTIRSDSEQYSGGEDISTSPPSSSSPAVVLYQAPTFWSILRGATINLFLPFVNGMMLGFGELFAHEAAFRLGWSGTRVCRDPLTLCKEHYTNSRAFAGIPALETTSAPDRPWNRSCRQAKEEGRARGFGELGMRVLCGMASRRDYPLGPWMLSRYLRYHRMDFGRVTGKEWAVSLYDVTSHTVADASPVFIRASAALHLALLSVNTAMEQKARS
jgi:hypothetical protein